MTVQYVSLYLYQSKVGCGWRSYLVLKHGRKHARLICTETAEALTVPASLIQTAKPLVLKRSRLARRLREVARCYGMEKACATRDALAMLRSPRLPA